METRLSRVDAEHNTRKTALEAAEAESAMQLERINSEKVALSQHADQQRLSVGRNSANTRQGFMLLCARDLQTHTVEMQIQRLLSSLPSPQPELLAQNFYEAYSKPAAHGSREDDPSERLPLSLDGNRDRKAKHELPVPGYKVPIERGADSASPHILHSDVRNLQGTSTAWDAKLSHDRNEGRTAHQESLDTGNGKSIERDDD